MLIIFVHILQDINKISYNIIVQQGAVDLLEMVNIIFLSNVVFILHGINCHSSIQVVGAPSGLASIKFEDFRCSFIPDAVATHINSFGQEEEVHQTEIQLMLHRFSLSELRPSRLKHPNYTTLLGTHIFNPFTSHHSVSSEPQNSSTTSSSTHEPYMKLKYIQHQVPKRDKPRSVYYSTKEVHIQFNGVQVSVFIS